MNREDVLREARKRRALEQMDDDACDGVRKLARACSTSALSIRVAPRPCSAEPSRDPERAVHLVATSTRREMRATRDVPETIDHVIAASFAYLAAQRDERLPRKPSG